ncbi:MAG: glycosyltransferase family 4 protein [Desulfobacterota bacterium]|nr:glycosyltransferase family 4 protein [Thermodesulfobacteriota bacterium]
MKVLIITGIFPPDIGGPATYVPMIATALSERGHAVRVITLSDVSAVEDSQRPYPVVRIKRSLWRPMRMALTMAVICRYGITADVLFVNGLALEAALVNLLLRKPLVQKVVGDLAWERARSLGLVHDTLDQFQTQQYSIPVAFLKKLRALWVRASTMIITPSKYLKNIVVGWGVPEEKITVIYNTVFDRGERTASFMPGDSVHKSIKNIVSVGRLVPWKGFDELITVCTALPDTQLFIIGEGPCRNMLQHHIDTLQAQERVHLVGACPHDEILSYLCRADLFVLNSRYEGFPHIVLEAMHVGVPVIATDAGGTSELVQDGWNGRLVLPGDTLRLMQAMREVLDNAALRTTLVENGFKTLERFSPEVLVDRTEQVLKTAVYGDGNLFRASSNNQQRISVLFLSTARFTKLADKTLVKKWSGLEQYFASTVLSLHDGTGCLRMPFFGATLMLVAAGTNRFITYCRYFFLALWQCMYGAVKKEYAAIIAQSPFQAIAPAIALLPWRLLRARQRPKLIVEIHNDWTEGVMLYHPGPFSRIEHACRMILGRFALAQADAYRVISEYCRGLLPPSQKPVFVFPTFTDLDSFAAPDPVCIEKMREQYGSNFFVSAGMLIELKGFSYLIRAFAELLKTHPDAHLVIAGKGRDEQLFKNLCRELYVDNRIAFVGHLEQATLAGLIKNALAFVLPSLTEGLGRVAIEAHMLGKPVIASRVGGIPEIVKHGTTGILVPPGDCQALSRAMKELLEHPEKAEAMGRAGRDWVKEKFDYTNYFSAYADMVSKVCAL